jgi:hypothetical protein
MKQLIFVHGINNQDRTVEEIQALWSNTLLGSLGALADEWWDDVQVRTAYYADVLFGAEQEWAVSSDTATPMSANSPDEDFAPDHVAALYIEMQQALGVPDDEVSRRLNEGEAHAPAERMGKGVHKRWLKAIARTLEDVVPGVAPGIARSFLPQAAAYLNKPGLFEEINELVEKQVFDPTDDLGQTVLVAHSLGTIVSYVLLRRKMGDSMLPLFVTLGSPLGIRIVKDRIQPPYVKPPIVRKWVNGSDREDFVALHPELTAHTFGPASITNIANLENGPDDPHDIAKYLAQPSIALVIGQALA